MANLPDKSELIGNSVTEAQFKQKLGVLIDNVASKDEVGTKKTEAIEQAKNDVANWWLDLLGSSTNLNNCIENKAYYCTSNTWATPENNYPSNQAGLLLVNNRERHIYQQYFDYQSRQVFYRSAWKETFEALNYTWYPWSRLATEQDLINLNSSISLILEKILLNIEALSDNFKLTHNENTGEKIYFSILDTVGRALFGIGSENFNWSGLDINFNKDSKSLIIADKNGNVLFNINESGINFGINLINNTRFFKLLDKSGFSSLIQMGDGSIYIPKLQVGELINRISAPTDTATIPPKLGLNYKADRIGIFSSGQSINLAATSTEALSTTQDFSNVMFKSGVICQANNALYDPSGFIQLVAQPVGNFDRSELPVINAANALSRKISAKGYDANQFSFFAQAVGAGGRTVENLNAEWLPRLKQQITDFKNLCTVNSQSCEVWALGWIQGEANYADPLVTTITHDAMMYMQKTSQFIDEATKHVIQTTGQRGLPYAYTYQTAAHLRYDPTSLEIAKAQWLLTKQQENFVLFMPAYTMTTHTDFIHLNSEYSWLMGEYMGRAIFHTQFSKQGKFRPLEPVSVNWTANYIDIEFHAPRYPIKFSTDICTQAENQGFTFWKNGAYQSGLISSVVILDYKTVRINLVAPVTDYDMEICFARGNPSVDTGGGRIGGARGNLVDSQGDFDQVTTPKGNVWKMYNSCVMFSYNRKTGFN